MFAYCRNNPVKAIDANGYSDKDSSKEDENDRFKLVGAGVQLSGSVSYGSLSGGGGIEIIVYWDTPECKEYEKIIVAVYVYGETDLSVDLECVDEIVELLTENADVLKVDGVNALEAILAGTKLEISATLSPVAVTANSQFYGVEDYTGGFQNKGVNVGSVTVATAWSDSCKTYSIGYTYSVGRSALHLKKPSISRGASYYGLLWTSK